MVRKSELRLSKRYAKALFELCDHAALDDVKDAFFNLRDTWLDNIELRDALTNPAYPVAQRTEALREISYYIRKDDEHFENFLLLLLRNNRLDLIPDLAKSFAGLVDDFKSMLNVTVVSAFELTDEEKGEILSRMKSDYSPMVSVSWEVNPSIIGGLMIKAGDLVLDGTLQGSLDKIRKSLIM